jgi:transcriptional regulator
VHLNPVAPNEFQAEDVKTIVVHEAGNGQVTVRKRSRLSGQGITSPFIPQDQGRSYTYDRHANTMCTAFSGEIFCGSQDYLLLSQRKCAILLLVSKMATPRKQKTDVLQGTLALMVLKTLDVLGSLHGYGIARRIEQISGDLLAVNQGTLYPVLLKLEQEGAIASEWGASENNRRARFYRLTREGRKQLQAETQGWEETSAIISRFFEVKAEDLS